MQICLLEPIPFLKVWGGRRLSRWFGTDWDGAVGEAAICMVRGGQANRIIGGLGTGLSLDELANRKPGLLGKYTPEKFPLICKFIAPVNGNLSLQVHPDKDHIYGVSDEPKDEVWYVVEVTKPPAVVTGLKLKPSEFLFAEEKRRFLKFLDVKVGDVLRIPPGAFHSLIAGNLVIEISTNSQTIYRLWDWDRKGRTLHVEEAVHAATEATVTILSGHEKLLNFGCVCEFESPFCRIRQYDALGGKFEVETRNHFAVVVVLWGVFRMGRHRIGRTIPVFIPAHTRLNVEVEQSGRMLLITPQ